MIAILSLIIHDLTLAHMKCLEAYNTNKSSGISSPDPKLVPVNEISTHLKEY